MPNGVAFSHKNEIISFAEKYMELEIMWCEINQTRETNVVWILSYTEFRFKTKHICMYLHIHACHLDDMK